MKRRAFFKTSALAAPAVVMGCNHPSSAGPGTSDELIEKVKLAMLSMQRASWEQGVALQAVMELGDINLALQMAKEAVLRQLPDGRLSVLYSDNGVTDPAASGPGVLFAAEYLEDEQLKKGAGRMLDYLLLRAPKTAEGILCHTLNGMEIWIDSMYMAPPFLAKAGQYKEAVKQVEGIRAALWNQHKGLYHHRWDAAGKNFISKNFWGVGNGWALAGIAKVIDTLPEEYHRDALKLSLYVKEHLDSCLKYMRNDGLSHNNLDDPNSFIETNLTQMVAYTIFTGIHSGWLEKEYRTIGENMRLVARSKVDRYGYVRDVCGAPHFNKPGVATEGQAFFLLMEAAWKKLPASGP